MKKHVITIILCHYESAKNNKNMSFSNTQLMKKHVITIILMTS